MLTDLIQVSFDKIMQTRSFTVIILMAEGKRFAIYTDPQIGKSLQMYLTGTEKIRPLTHDLIDVIFQAMHIRIKQVVISDLQDTVYFAKLYLEQRHDDRRFIVEVDARPSDCIILALMNNVPVFCTRDVLDRTIPVEE